MHHLCIVESEGIVELKGIITSAGLVASAGIVVEPETIIVKTPVSLFILLNDGISEDPLR